MKIPEKNKTLLLRARKVFPEVYTWMQQQANRETPFEDVVYALEQLIKQDGVMNPWGFLKTVIKTKQNKEEIVEREETWKRKQIKESEDVLKWIASFTTK